MRLLALKINVGTYRGTLHGVPRLVEILQRHAAGATFLFTMGADHSGRALSRIFKPGQLKRARRTEALKHYGCRSLMYGTLLPGPNIARGGAHIMRNVRDRGFETGVHGLDRIRWQDRAELASADWTAREMEQACSRYTDVFKTAPLVHGAIAWQMNPHALRLTQRLGFRYASDSRGSHPFLPVQNGEIVLCPQVPTSLPTLDELVVASGLSFDNAHETLLRHTAPEPQHGHVFTLSAEREGMKLSASFEKLLTGWREQGYSVVAMQDIADRLDRDTLPHHHVLRGVVPGRLGTLMVQGAEFLANWQTAA